MADTDFTAPGNEDRDDEAGLPPYLVDFSVGANLISQALSAGMSPTTKIFSGGGICERRAHQGWRQGGRGRHGRGRLRARRRQ